MADRVKQVDDKNKIFQLDDETSYYMHTPSGMLRYHPNKNPCHDSDIVVLCGICKKHICAQCYPSHVETCKKVKR